MELFNHATVRELSKEDLPFITSSFIQSLSKYKESIFKGWEHENITSYLEYLIFWALNNPNYSILIACNPQDSDHILAYLITNPKTNEIFYQYTKHSLRGCGIQKLMLMPLLLKMDEPIISNWPTKQMLKLAKQNRIVIMQKFILDILKGNKE